jgi:hypothetical protein
MDNNTGNRALKNLSNANLLNGIKVIVCKERNATFKVLDYLREIESRHLHLEEGYSSMFEFCLKFLGYDESQTQGRLSAMRLMCERPSIEPKVSSGELSLSALSKAKSTFNKMAKFSEALSASNKIEILKTLENKSIRDCEAELIKVCPEVIPNKLETQRCLTENLSEVKLILKKDLLSKISKLKELLSHKKPNLTTTELINYLVSERLEKIDSGAKKRTMTKVQKITKIKAQGKDPANDLLNAPLHAPEHVKTQKPNRYISTETRKQVWVKNGHQCSFVNLEAKRRCNSRFRLEIDHIKPFAVGGSNLLDNLRLLWKAHNLQQAIEIYGAEKMAAFIPEFT